MPEPTPEAWALIRHAYEQTSRPIVDICAEHGITDPMLRYRVKRWGWQKRRSLIPQEGPPPVLPLVIPGHAPLEASAESLSPRQDRPAPAVVAAAHTVDPRPAEGDASADSAAIVPRLQSAVTRLLPAIETVIAQLAGGPHSPHAMAQAARALGTLTRALRELNTLLAQHEAGGHQGLCPNCAELPTDLDAFREQLAKRIDALFASEQDEDREDLSGQTADSGAQAKPAETW